MNVIESDRTTFFDCDDTLIMWYKVKKDLPVVNINGREFQVHTKHVQKILDYHLMGFKVEINDFQGNVEGTEDYDDGCISIELIDSMNQTFASFDFLGGEFYRISATDSTGWYGDEVDLKKYC